MSLTQADEAKVRAIAQEEALKAVNAQMEIMGINGQGRKWFAFFSETDPKDAWQSVQAWKKGLTFRADFFATLTKSSGWLLIGGVLTAASAGFQLWIRGGK